MEETITLKKDELLRLRTLLMWARTHLYHGRQLKRRDDKDRCIKQARENVDEAETIVCERIFSAND